VMYLSPFVVTGTPSRYRTLCAHNSPCSTLHGRAEPTQELLHSDATISTVSVST
jgi:hypothetical protein